MSKEISANLILVNGKGHDVSYLVQGREVDKSDHPRTDLFQPGKYPFYWPGAICSFGGGIEDGGDVRESFARELREELDWALTPEDILGFDHRFYNWKEDTLRILDEADEVFQGNVAGFLGFSLDEKIPACVLGQDRQRYEGKSATYQDWLYCREEGDHYFVGDISVKREFTDLEGVGAFWVPHYIARSLVVPPCDKVALLDDMTRRVKDGKLEIRVKRE